MKHHLCIEFDTDTGVASFSSPHGLASEELLGLLGAALLEYSHRSGVELHETLAKLQRNWTETLRECADA